MKYGVFWGPLETFSYISNEMKRNSTEYDKDKKQHEDIRMMNKGRKERGKTNKAN